MGSAVELRDDYSAKAPYHPIRISRDVRQSGKILSITAVPDGMSPADAARIGDIGLSHRLRLPLAVPSSPP